MFVNCDYLELTLLFFTFKLNPLKILGKDRRTRSKLNLDLTNIWKLWLSYQDSINKARIIFWKIFSDLSGISKVGNGLLMPS